MTETFVKVGMQIIADVAILFDQPKRILILDKFLLKATTLRRFGLGIGNIADGDALRAILRPYPVGIW